MLIWSTLPPEIRALTKPVAAADYWQCGKIRSYLAHRIFKAVLISRKPTRHTDNPIKQMVRELEHGFSLIIFPEGTRNTNTDALLPFKSGPYHLAKEICDLEFVPVWISNVGRVLPKGSFLPAPLLCKLTYGDPITLKEGETREAFLARMREALITLSTY